MDSIPCVIDVGTGRTKIGFAGSEQPQFTIPSYVGIRDSQALNRIGSASKVLSDLDFAIGDDLSAFSKASQKSPMKNGLINDYTLYEKMMSSIIYSYLSVDPSQHYFFLTEPPLNTPENREFLAELMFETFVVGGIYIGMQALMALTASWTKRAADDRPTTGIVVDSGHGLTHIIPVVSGYSIGTSMRYLPIAGTEMTSFTQQLVRERESGIPPDCLYNVAKNVKEMHGYTCRNIVTEFNKLETEPQKIIRTYKGINHLNSSPFEFEMSYERFLASELFFRPEIYNPEFTHSLDSLIFDSVYSCPVDVRRGLLKNVVMSGGSTIYPNLHRRIDQDLKKIIETRYSGASTTPEVSVTAHSRQQYAVYFGSSMMASTPEFNSVVHNRTEYQEHGPSICRNNAIFGLLC